MSDYFAVFVQATQGYGAYLLDEIARPHWGSYLYWLVGLSLAVYALELLFPWRRGQPRIRKDFWLDAFYMLFNIVLFSLVGFAGAAEVAATAWRDMMAAVGIDIAGAQAVAGWPPAVQVVLLFVTKDFVHWMVHRVLHRVPVLWEFHKVHHSVEQMGFAAHMRFHWMENVVYKAVWYVPFAFFGFGIDDFLWAHLVATGIGHLNHANVALPMGPLRYVFNSARMHIWHHAWELPSERRWGMNFGLSLSLWDYLFGTACVPGDGRDVRLGFPGLERYPKTFLGQTFHNFAKP